jgi:hypothetical protein
MNPFTLALGGGGSWAWTVRAEGSRRAERSEHGGKPRGNRVHARQGFPRFRSAASPALTRRVSVLDSTECRAPEPGGSPGLAGPPLTAVPELSTIPPLF